VAVVNERIRRVAMLPSRRYIDLKLVACRTLPDSYPEPSPKRRNPMSRWMALVAPAAVMASCSWCLLAAADNKPADVAWPQFRGPNRDDHSPDKGLAKAWPSEGPPLVWKAAGLGIGFSTVSIADGRVFTMGDREQQDNGKGEKSCFVIALNLADGKEIWSTRVGKPGGNHAGPRCTPTVDGDRLYALGQFGDLVCLESATGKEVWRKNLPSDFQGTSGGWNYTESPLVDGDRLICTPGGRQHTLLALNKRTGEVVPGWKGAVPGGSKAGYSSIVVSHGAGKRQYVQLLAEGVVGIAVEDGEFLWRYAELAKTTANVPTPIVQGDFVFCSAGYNKGGALLRLVPDCGSVKAEVVYYNHELKNKHGGVVLVGDAVYGDRDDSGFPYCADFKTGKVSPGWTRAREAGKKGRGSAAVTFADGHLYFRYDNGFVALVPADPAGYEEKGSFKIPNSRSHSWPHPVVVGGRLYLREQDTLWVYDVSPHAGG
jgi:outer membrane protein assembly factor BamB